MSVIIQDSDKKEKSWNAEFNVFGAGDMCFSYNGKTLLKSDGIELGVLKELNGIEKICRSHYSEKTKWSWVETETLHPFGSEPVIKRKWEQAANHIKVVSDIIIRSTMPVEQHVSLDSLSLPGKWKKVLIFSQLNPESTDISIEEFDLSDFLGKEKKLDFIPLVLLFFGEDGTELEIGAGYDLWRWHEAASRFGGKGEFVLKGTNEGLLFGREIHFQDEDSCLSRDNFRFSWYFAWGNVNDHKSSIKYNTCSQLTPSGKKLISDGACDKHIYCLDNMKWPSFSVVEGTQNKYPCFCSRQTGNYMKSWFRSLYNKIKSQNTDVYLCDIDIHICSNASHMIRGKRKKLIHWDFIYLLGFWEWANKYLGDTGNHFYVVFSKNSLFADLPSVKGLSREF